MFILPPGMLTMTTIRLFQTLSRSEAGPSHPSSNIMEMPQSVVSIVSLHSVSLYSVSLYSVSLYSVSLYSVSLYSVSLYSVSLYFNEPILFWEDYSPPMNGVCPHKSSSIL